MDVAYIIWIVALFVYAKIVADISELSPCDWRFWVLAIMPVISHVSGRFRGF